MWKIVSSIMVISFLYSCGTESKEKTKELSMSDEEVHNMIKTNCYSCHNPNSESHDAIIAPPLVAVKKRYSKEYTSKEEFIKAMSEFTYMPSDDKYLMQGAVNKFGLMPRTALNKSQLELVAKYIFENDVDEPEWYQEHFEEEHGKNGKKRNMKRDSN